MKNMLINKEVYSSNCIKCIKKLDADKQNSIMPVTRK